MSSSSDSVGFWFPGRWVGGVTLILAPLVLLTGMVLRLQFHFFYPQQLAAFETNPTLMTAAYSMVVAGIILLAPAVLTLIMRIGATQPGWATWGGILVLFGLFARTFHAGIDHLAFQLVRIESLEQATKTISESYGAFHVVAALNAAILFGWIVLAIGAYRSKTMGLVRSVALGLMSALMLGVLKGSSWVSVIATAGLCLALVPLGITVLKDGPQPSNREVAGWVTLVVGLMAGFFWLGQQG